MRLVQRGQVYDTNASVCVASYHTICQLFKTPDGRWFELTSDDVHGDILCPLSPDTAREWLEDNADGDEGLVERYFGASEP